MTSAGRSTAKICGRCESFFPNIKSRTCPQCFAPLVELTEEEAQRALLAISALKDDPELSQQTAQEDERFKEQSFGACLAVVGVVFLAALLSVVFIVLAARHKPSPLRAGAGRPAAAGSPAEAGRQLPKELGGLQRVSISMVETLPSSHLTVWHASYTGGLDIYMAPSSRLTGSQTAALQFAGAMVAEQHTPPLIQRALQTRSATYVVLASSYAVTENGLKALSTLD